MALESWRAAHRGVAAAVAEAGVGAGAGAGAVASAGAGGQLPKAYLLAICNGKTNSLWKVN